MFLNDEKFDLLYTKWIKSGCKKPLKPSVDRIDCLKFYTKDNIQITTWAENREKENYEFAKIRARLVYKHNGAEIVCIYKSVSDAVEKTMLSQSGISMCLNGKRKTCGGYYWSYGHENKELLK